MNPNRRLQTLLTAFAALILLQSGRGRAGDGPVRVFVFAGQSNMVGYGRTENLPSNNNGEAGTLRGMVNADSATFGFGGTNPLVDSSGDWLVRDDVNVYARNDIGFGPSIEKGGHTSGFGVIGWNGPDYGFGQVVGNALDRDVLILKVAKNGTSLGVNWRSPSAVANRGGAVGDMWTTMTSEVSSVLSNLGAHFPEYAGRGYQFAGFGWHQGWNDGSSVALHSEYEANLVDLIADVRTEYGSGLPVVIANTGMLNFPSLQQSRPNVLMAQNNLGDPTLHPEFVGNVAVVDTTPLWRPPTESPKDEVFHWHQNGETMYDIGAGMGGAYLALAPAESGVAGDYNNDGAVDAADYAVWRESQGAPAGSLLNDPVGNPIGLAQYHAWIANYGATGPATASTAPEPLSASLVAMGVLAAGVQRSGRSNPRTPKRASPRPRVGHVLRCGSAC